MSYQYGALGIFLVIAVLFGAAALIVSRLLQPRKVYPEKYDTYECGMETIGETWIQFKVQYFLYALIFLIFDVESVFLYPWAVTFTKLGLFAFVEMFIFLAILIVGFWYAWKEGVFEWQ